MTWPQEVRPLTGFSRIDLTLIGFEQIYPTRFDVRASGCIIPHSNIQRSLTNANSLP